MVDQAIWSKKMSNGMRRTPVSAEQVCIMKEILNINVNIKSYKTEVYQQMCPFHVFVC